MLNIPKMKVGIVAVSRDFLSETEQAFMIPEKGSTHTAESPGEWRMWCGNDVSPGRT